MQESVTSMDPDFPDVHIQFDTNLGMVGFALEPKSEIPQLIDKWYGDVPTQIQIGRLFFEKRREDFEEHLGLEDPRDEAEFYNALGRDILDAVTGSREGVYSLWTYLERPSVNRLIRLTRKARDVTFGRDE